MDVADSGPYFSPSHGDIARADVWQIYYLPPVVDDNRYHERRPFAPWKPFGRTNKRNCDFESRLTKIVRDMTCHIGTGNGNSKTIQLSRIKALGRPLPKAFARPAVLS